MKMKVIILCFKVIVTIFLLVIINSKHVILRFTLAIMYSKLVIRISSCVFIFSLYGGNGLPYICHSTIVLHCCICSETKQATPQSLFHLLPPSGKDDISLSRSKIPHTKFTFLCMHDMELIFKTFATPCALFTNPLTVPCRQLPIRQEVLQ